MAGRGEHRATEDTAETRGGGDGAEAGRMQPHWRTSVGRVSLTDCGSPQEPQGDEVKLRVPRRRHKERRGTMQRGSQRAREKAPRRGDRRGASQERGAGGTTRGDAPS